MTRSDTRINIVSGGYAVCLTCSTQLAEVPAICPVCRTPLVSGSFRLVRDAAANEGSGRTRSTRAGRGKPGEVRSGRVAGDE